MSKGERNRSKKENRRAETGEISRRQFLQDAGLVIGGVTIGSMALLSACGRTGETTTEPSPTGTTIGGIIYSPDTQRTNRIPPGQHETESWPVLQAGGVLQIDPQDWTFTLSGLVDEEKVLSYSEFMELPRVKVLSDVHCVTTWSRLDNLWEGPGSQTIAGLANIKPEAGFVIVKASGGFTANLTLSDFLQTDVIFAVKHDDQPLSAEHGAPVRLVVPRLYFWKSAKWVTGLEFTDEDRPGFWESVGYHNRGDPWKEERH
ncbi:MAG: sulfite oxidase-like oxidoreductase [Dehalococcoidales bacterium]|nr:sulfite oxidase-like oxidoreductase [Dehalococcoidales bacterium]